MGYSERRFELRKRTRANHERLDAAVGTFATLEEYRRYVSRLGAFRSAMDAQMRHVVWPQGWRWRPTAVSDAIARDADDLGLPPAHCGREHIHVADASALLGALYVLEGSTLGARVLRQRAAGLGMGEAFGARHLALLTADPVQWQSFLQLLEDVRDFDIERAAAAANAVFTCALRCFEGDRGVAS